MGPGSGRAELRVRGHTLSGARHGEESSRPHAHRNRLPETPSRRPSALLPERSPNQDPDIPDPERPDLGAGRPRAGHGGKGQALRGRAPPAAPRRAGRPSPQAALIGRPSPAR